MRKYKLIILLIIPFILTSCYDYKELNTIAIVTATEIDKIDNNYKVLAQVATPQAADKSVIVQSPFFIYQGIAPTIQEAYRNITLESPRLLYQNHLDLLIINENIAKEDISEILDFYIRNPGTRTEFYVLISDSPILELITPINNISSLSIKNSLKTNHKYLGTTNLITFDNLITMYKNPNREIIIPHIKIITTNNKDTDSDNTKTSIINNKYVLDGLSIFKNNKLLTTLNKEETLYYNLIKNNIENTIYSYECGKNKYLSLELTNSNTDISIDKDNINIKISLSGDLTETHCNINNLDTLKKDIEKDIKDKLSNHISYIVDTYDTDIYGFLDMIYKYQYSYYKEIKDNYSLKNFKININPKLEIYKKGNIMEGVNEKNN